MVRPTIPSFAKLAAFQRKEKSHLTRSSTWVWVCLSLPLPLFPCSRKHGYCLCICKALRCEQGRGISIPVWPRHTANEKWDRGEGTGTCQRSSKWAWISNAGLGAVFTCWRKPDQAGGQTEYAETCVHRWPRNFRIVTASLYNLAIFVFPPRITFFSFSSFLSFLHFSSLIFFASFL